MVCYLYCFQKRICPAYVNSTRSFSLFSIRRAGFWQVSVDKYSQYRPETSKYGETIQNEWFKSPKDTGNNELEWRPTLHVRGSTAFTLTPSKGIQNTGRSVKAVVFAGIRTFDELNTEIGQQAKEEKTSLEWGNHKEQLVGWLVVCGFFLYVVPHIHNWTLQSPDHRRNTGIPEHLHSTYPAWNPRCYRSHADCDHVHSGRVHYRSGRRLRLPKPSIHSVDQRSFRCIDRDCVHNRSLVYDISHHWYKKDPRLHHSNDGDPLWCCKWRPRTGQPWDFLDHWDHLPLRWRSYNCTEVLNCSHSVPSGLPYSFLHLNRSNCLHNRSRKTLGDVSAGEH